MPLTATGNQFLSTSVKQYIIRNFEMKGYETVYTSTGEDIPESLLHHVLPKYAIKEQESYFFKNPLNNGSTLLKLVIGDGVDNFGRNKAKIILFIVPKDVYNTHGLIYYVTPLWNKMIPMENDEPLTEIFFDTFNNPDINNIRDNINFDLCLLLLQYLLTYENLVINFEKNEATSENITFLSKTLAFIDWILPNCFKSKISIKTACGKDNVSLANCSIVLSNDFDVSILKSNQKLFTYSKNKMLYKSDFDSIQIFNQLILAKSFEEKEEIGKIICDYKKVIKENLVPQNIYKKIMNRFGIEGPNGIYHLLTQIKNTIQLE